MHTVEQTVARVNGVQGRHVLPEPLEGHPRNARVHTTMLAPGPQNTLKEVTLHTV